MFPRHVVHSDSSSAHSPFMEVCDDALTSIISHTEYAVDLAAMTLVSKKVGLFAQTRLNQISDWSPRQYHDLLSVKQMSGCSLGTTPVKSGVDLGKGTVILLLEDGTLKLVDLESQTISDIALPAHAVVKTVNKLDQNRVVISCLSGAVIVFDLQTKKEDVIAQHAAAIVCVAILNNKIISAAVDGSVIVTQFCVESNSFTQERSFVLENDYATNLKLIDQNRLVCLGSTTTAYLFDPSDFSLKKSIFIPLSANRYLDYIAHANRNSVILGNNKTSLYEWNVLNDKLEKVALAPDQLTGRVSCAELTSKLIVISERHQKTKDLACAYVPAKTPAERARRAQLGRVARPEYAYYLSVYDLNAKTRISAMPCNEPVTFILKLRDGNLITITESGSIHEYCFSLLPQLTKKPK